MSNNDTELFGLCKAVYEATGWDDNGADLMDTFKDGTPIYDSDYLLEKLPAYIESGHLELANFDTAGWQVGYYNGNPTLVALQYTIQEADTPLKALLKLTLKLHEQGLLPSTNKKGFEL